MTVKIKHNKAHVLYKALRYDHCKLELLVLMGEKIWSQKSSKFMVILLIKPPDHVA